MKMNGDNKDIIIQNADYVVCGAGKTAEHIDIYIGDGKVVKLTPTKPEHSREDGRRIPYKGRTIDGRGMIVIPGLINSHTHCYQALLKGIRDDLCLNDWVSEVTMPFVTLCRREEQHTESPRLSYLSAMLGACEMLHSGITSFVDLDYAREEILNAYEEIGMRGTLCIQLVDRWLPEEVLAQLGRRKKSAEELLERWNNRGLLQISLSPSTPFSATPELIQWINETADRYGIGLHVHIAETEWEIERCNREFGMSPFAYLDSLGFFERPVNAVHSVHITDEDLALMEKKKVTVSYCPKSNAKLGSGVAPVRTMLERRIPVSIATDGFASNDTNDMFEEMRFGALVQKAVHKDAAVLGAEDVFAMATSEAARIPGQAGGRIEKGGPADLVLLKRGKAHSEPVHDLIQNIVYCGKSEDVDTVLINGRIVMENGVILTVDEEHLIEEARETGRQLQAAGLFGKR